MHVYQLCSRILTGKHIFAFFLSSQNFNSHKIQHSNLRFYNTACDFCLKKNKVQQNLYFSRKGRKKSRVQINKTSSGLNFYSFKQILKTGPNFLSILGIQDQEHFKIVRLLSTSCSLVYIDLESIIHNTTGKYDSPGLQGEGCTKCTLGLTFVHCSSLHVGHFIVIAVLNCIEKQYFCLKCSWCFSQIIKKNKIRYKESKKDLTMNL